MTEIAAIKISPKNRQVLQRLKLVLSLELRRCIGIAVCDDLPVRDKLAAYLQAEFGYPPSIKKAAGLVSLRLNMRHPDPVAQIGHWLGQHPAVKNAGTLPAFQILGIENLMREQPALQWTFLSNLREIERNLPNLEANLLLWVTRPWLRSIQDSAPEFWNWRTAIFEFEGEPKPATTFETPSNTISSATASQKKTAPQVNPTLNKNPVPSLPPAKQKSAVETVINLPTDAEIEEELSSFILDDFTADLEPAKTETSQETEVKQTSEPAIQISATSHPPDFDLKSAFTTLKQQSPEISELVELIVATTTQEIAAGALNHSYSPISTLQEIEQLYQQTPSNNALASAYQILGDNYRFRIERGQISPEYLIIAIRAYEQMLEYLEPHSPQSPDILNDIANLYWMLSRYIANPEQKLPYLDLAIHCYNAALMNIQAAENAQSYALIQNNLGAVYGDIARYRHPAQNLQQSVLSYQEALRYRRPDPENPEATTTKQYAATLNNIGTAYWNLAQHQQPLGNLKQSISAYNEALRYYHPEKQPLDFGMLQNNLGTAYWNLAQYENPQENLPQAIKAYEIALTYRTPENNAAGCAATQNNLATAYWHLASQTKANPKEYSQFLKKSITAYEIALAIAAELTKGNQPTRLTFDIFAAHNNLGLAHYQLATHPQTELQKPQKTQHLETALHHHLQALQGWQNQPDFYKTALNFVIQTIRASYTETGISGQNLALSKLPPNLLPEILPKL
ncbi:tetratricopeptide repeat protein [Ancylothrix sp. C2]|uniref:tetratricopeptide repeat protein n=1 Tax=Ancylothrix sp. D3o TaxID=2953691 RepID=UPI0021BB1901|nr:tetratricopeptide repeat protein [Ancylothrix sp. D3o]MCT7951421.1 tetratricopeptide repeat protein [Ancylothrix sp. D3o]